MELFAVIVIAPLLAAYLSSRCCRLSLRLSRAPSWLIAPLSIALGVVVNWAVTFQKDLFHPSRWSSKVDGPFMLALTGVPAALLAAAVAIPVVCLYRQKYERSRVERQQAPAVDGETPLPTTGAHPPPTVPEQDHLAS
jgi:hypothetical protein